HSAGDAGVPALVAGVSHHSSDRLEAPCARLVDDPGHDGYDDCSLHHRDLGLHLPAILVAGTYPGAQHAAVAIRRTIVRRGVVADPARRPADAGAGHRGRAVAD